VKEPAVISPDLEPRRWPVAKLLVMIALVMAVQAGLIWRLGGPLPPVRRTTAPAPRFSLAGPVAFLDDPTLFALPHREGFAGSAWLKLPKMEFNPANWSESNRWLVLPVEQLGALFQNFVRTNPAPRFSTVAPFQPDLVEPELPVEPLVTASRIRVEGDLARRRLLSRLDPGPQAAVDLLTNSVVQVLVDAQGNTLSPVLLSGCGSPTADQRALALAKSARFSPLPAPGSGEPEPPPTIGRLVFEWQTLPLATTNSPSAAP